MNEIVLLNLSRSITFISEGKPITANVVKATFPRKDAKTKSVDVALVEYQDEDGYFLELPHIVRVTVRESTIAMEQRLR